MEIAFRHVSAIGRPCRLHRREWPVPATGPGAERSRLRRVGLAHPVPAVGGARRAWLVGAIEDRRDTGLRQGCRRGGTGRGAAWGAVSAPSGCDACGNLRRRRLLRDLLSRDELCARARDNGARLSEGAIPVDPARRDPVHGDRYNRGRILERRVERATRADLGMRRDDPDRFPVRAVARVGKLVADLPRIGRGAVRDGAGLWPARKLADRALPGARSLYGSVGGIQCGRYPWRRDGADRRAGAGGARRDRNGGLLSGARRDRELAGPLDGAADRYASQSSVSFALPTLRSASNSRPATSTASFSPVSIEIQLSGPIQPRRPSLSSATLPAPVP